MKILHLPITFLSLLLPLATTSPTLHTNVLAKRAPSVLSPVYGQTVHFPGNHTQITWTEPSTRDVRIALVRGPPGQVVEVGPYESYEDNDGRYEWLNEDYDDPELKSGCDYKFRVSIQTDEDDLGESEYFVIVKEGDGGLTDDTMCPGPRGSEGQLVRYADLATTAADANTGNPSDEADAGGADGSVVSSSSSDGVSRTTLIIAVVVSDIGILLLLAAIVFWGRRRSWFVSRDFLATYVGVVQRARERLEEQNYDHSQPQTEAFVKPSGHAPTKEESYVDVASDGSQTGRSYNTGQRDMKIAQLE